MHTSARQQTTDSVVGNAVYMCVTLKHLVGLTQPHVYCWYKSPISQLFYLAFSSLLQSLCCRKPHHCGKRQPLSSGLHANNCIVSLSGLTSLPMVKYLNRLAGVALSIDRTIRTPEHCFSQEKAAGMTYICRLTQQLASLWLLLYKGCGICQLDFEILQKMSSVVNTSL